MPVCSKCAAPVIAGRVAETNEVLGFDAHEQTHGAGRYVQGDDGLFRPCRDSYGEAAFVNHELTCAANHRRP